MKRILMFLMAFTCLIPMLMAQEYKTVTGTVVSSEDKLPISGAAIRAKTNLNLGTITDVEGKFSLTIPSTVKTLIVSFVGMQTAEIAVANTPLHVMLNPDDNLLNEVVVTGYQELDRRKLSSAISSLQMKDMGMNNATSLDQMLQGKIAGVTVMNLSATPDVAPKIRIRGSSTITGNREPVWVVDGVILDEPVAISTEELNNIDNVNFVGNAISGLNPSDIERIDILKDASATAIYGVKAANGVIVVTTKHGREGTPSVSYTGTVGLTMAPNYGILNLMNSNERVQVSEEMVQRGLQFYTYLPTNMAYEGELHKLWSKEISYDAFRQNVKMIKEMNTDWMDLLFDNALTQQHTLSLSGGSKKADYYASIGYATQPGVSQYEDFDRYTAYLRVNSQLSSKLKVGVKVNTSISKSLHPHSSISLLNYAYQTSRAIPAYDAQGNYFFYDNATTSYGNLPFNIFNELEHSGKEINRRSMMMNVNLDWSPLNWLKLSSLASLSYSNTSQDNWADAQTFYASTYRLLPAGVTNDTKDFLEHTELPLGGELDSEQMRNVKYMWRNSVELKYDFANVHHLYANVGQELSSLQYNGTNSTRFGYLPFRGKKFATVDFSKYPRYAQRVQNTPDVITDNLINTVSMYGAFTYSYDNRYIANFNVRTDGSNRFGQDKSVRFLPVWSVSGRWNVHNEQWLKTTDWIDELALRASYGVQGNVHPSQTPYLIIRQDNYVDRLGEFVSTLKQFPNNSLHWEKTVSYNVGLDFSLLKNRLSATVDLYKKRGYDQIVERRIASSNGATMVALNEGDIENKGWELGLNVVPVLTKDWVWSLSFNTGRNFNKVTREGNSPVTWESYINGSLVANGYPVNSFYSYRFKGLDPNTGLPTFYGESEKDSEGKTIINSEEEAYAAAFVYSGQREPDLSGGFSSSLKYKNFTLNALFSFSMGSHIRLNDLYLERGQALPFPQQNMSREFVDRWQQPGDELRTQIPVLSDKNLEFAPYDRKYPIANNRWDMYNKSDIRVVSGNFLRCRALSLRYDFGRQLYKNFHIKGGSVSFEASNVFVIKDSRLKGRDPEQLALSSGTIPPQIGYSLQLNLNF